MKQTISIILFCVLLWGAGPALNAQNRNERGDVPATISYQGVLFTPGGVPVADGMHVVTLSLYGDPTGTGPIWRDQYSVNVSGGVFGALLGGGTVPLPKPEAMNRALWVGLAVDGGDELRPLTPLAASPYALNVADGAVTTEKLADGSVTPEKLSRDYVSSLSVNEIKLTGDVNLKGSDGVRLDYDKGSNSLLVGLADEDAETDKKEGGGGRRPMALGAELAWRYGGDLVDSSHEMVVVPSAANNWIGTSSSSVDKDFIVKIDGQRAMKFQLGGVGSGVPNVIGGSSANAVGVLSSGCFIGGGEGNQVGDNAENDVIAGGFGNRIEDHTAGFNNAILGGYNNVVAWNCDNSVVGGGSSNRIDSSCVSSVVSGGIVNLIYVRSRYSVISGGDHNEIGPACVDVVVAGGSRNIVNGSCGESVISGGGSNVIEGSVSYATISGGASNRIRGSNLYSVIGGGYYNIIDSGGAGSTISGGSENDISGTALFSAIAGGQFNSVSGSWSSIGGGDSNEVTRNRGVVCGGRVNRMEGSAGAIVGGESHFVGSAGGFVGGGYGDSIDLGGSSSVIVGGISNHVYGYVTGGVIGGGYHNKVAKGAFSLADATDYSVIGGGTENSIEAKANTSTIGGGIGNAIKSVGVTATIPGGEFLIANGWAQTVVGTSNIERPGPPWRYGGAGSGAFDQRLFIVGNGYSTTTSLGVDTTIRSNAFEVSYNGHSVVYDRNHDPAAAPKPAIRGATYTDNVVYAWGEIGAGGTATCNGFGIDPSNTKRKGLGWYRVVLNVVDPDNVAFTFTCSSVTATLSSGTGPTNGTPVPSCMFIRTSEVGLIPGGGGKIGFDVYISQNKIPVGPSPTLECESVDSGFFFKVTGTPSSE